MERLRKRLKKFLYGSCPGYRGRFPYFGAMVHFPLNSFAFALACEEGIYEAQNVRLLRSLVGPGTWMFDVGANIGLMSLPVLNGEREARALSFEPSPNTAPWLERTIAGSPYAERWRLVRKVAGRKIGTTEFHVSPPTFDLFDGVPQSDRIRGGVVHRLEMTTLDAEWDALGCPQVSVIKIDVEGWESEVLAGAGKLITAQKPPILLEWNKANLRVAGVAFTALLDMARDLGYRILNLPDFIEVGDAEVLRLQMLRGESFLLIPSGAKVAAKALL